MNKKTKKKIWIFTLFPDYFTAFFSQGVTARAQEFFDLQIVNLRDFSKNNYRSVDDTPYGGGPGMVIRADVCFDALSKTIFEPAGIAAETWTAKTHTDPFIIDFSPRGMLWDNKLARNFATEILDENLPENIVFFCGRYEGIDERFVERFVHRTYSIGDFVLSGAEIALQAILDSSFRFLPGVLGNVLSAQQDSFEAALLDAPCYTKPREFLGMSVPDVLMSGHHLEIEKYQNEQRYAMTQKYRPHLLQEDFE